MERHFRSQLDGSLLSSFEESLLEIDDEEDSTTTTTTTTDFCEPFFAASGFPSFPAAAASAIASEQSCSSPSTSCRLFRHDNIHLALQGLLELRLCKHNKDLRFICCDGGAQIDPVILMPFVRKHGTSSLGQILALMGHHQLLQETSALTVILPDVHLHELNQLMTLFHKGRVVSPSEKEKQAITDLLSLLGLSLDGLIIEEEVPKLPQRPIDQEQHQPEELILSIRAPLAREDLLTAACSNEIKRSNNLHQKMALFFALPSESKNAWNPTSIKEEETTVCDAEDVKDFFVDPNLISITNSAAATVVAPHPATTTGPGGANTSQENNSRHQLHHPGGNTNKLQPICNEQGIFLDHCIMEENAKTDEAIYTCDLCDFSPKFTLVAFLKHQKQHANDSPYKCSYPGCKKTFKTLSEFRTHKRVAHKPRLKSCNPSSKSSVKSNADYYCNQCNKRFKSVGSLKTHMISHMSLPALPASLMKKESDLTVPESVAKGVFTCRICSTPHVTWTEFSKHFQRAHGAVPKILLQYKCVPCDLLFQNKQVYLDHTRKCHGLKQQVLPNNLQQPSVASSAPNRKPDSNKIVVLSAEKNFQLSNNVLQIVNPTSEHAKTSVAHTTSNEKKHICNICSRAFKRSDNLKAHARTVHYGLKPNNCGACGKGYRTKNELLRHQAKSCPFRELNHSDFKLDFDESLLV